MVSRKASRYRGGSEEKMRCFIGACAGGFASGSPVVVVACRVPRARRDTSPTRFLVSTARVSSAESVQSLNPHRHLSISAQKEGGLSVEVALSTDLTVTVIAELHNQAVNY